MQLTGGKAFARDTVLDVVWMPVAQADKAVTVRAGASLPTGRLGPNISFTPFSSRSVDPHLVVSGVAGGTWLGMVDLEARTPLYAGPDGITQGAWLRGDVRAARRLPRAAVFAGASSVRVTPASIGTGAFTELAAVAGGAWTPAEDIGLNFQVRVPVYGAPAGTAYDLAAGIGLTWVTGGKGADKDDDDDGDDHH